MSVGEGQIVLQSLDILYLALAASVLMVSIALVKTLLELQKNLKKSEEILSDIHSSTTAVAKFKDSILSGVAMSSLAKKLFGGSDDTQA